MEICKHPDVGRIIFINDEIILNLTPRVLFSYLDEGFVPFLKTSMVVDGMSTTGISTIKDFSYGTANDGPACAFQISTFANTSLSFYALDYDSNFKVGVLSDASNDLSNPDPNVA